jgi:hypothetical protein
VKRLPWESARDAALRLLASDLGISKGEVEIVTTPKNSMYKEEQSEHYPGTMTMYRRQEFDVHLHSKTTPARLSELGIGEYGPGEFQGPKGLMIWRLPCTRTRHSADGISDDNEEQDPAGSKESGDEYTEQVRFLAMLPITQTRLNTVEIRRKLEQYGVDYSKWSPKNLEDFCNEVIDGEADLVEHQGADGKPSLIRVCRITIVRLYVGESVLIESTKEEMGTETALDRLPAAKQRSNEHPFLAARRHLNMHIGIDEEVQPYSFDKNSGGQKIIKKEAQKLPGLQSVYVESVVFARLNEKAGDLHSGVAKKAYDGHESRGEKGMRKVETVVVV